MRYIEHSYNGKTIYEAVLSKEDPVILSFFTVDKTASILKTFNTIWDCEEFNRINLPSVVHPLTQKNREIFDNLPEMRILDMPIKFPGSNYRIPKEISSLAPIIYDIARNEYNANKKSDDYYCYITVDCRDVEPGKTTRKSGLHVDGFQGARISPKLPVDHSYIVSNNNPTIFYNQPFKVGEDWDMNCHNYFEGFELQKDVSKQVVYPNHSVLLIDAYCLHEAPVATEKQKRTFLRMSYTVREFDRLGNAHNPLFDYNWEMVPRDIQSTLSCPVSRKMKI